MKGYRRGFGNGRLGFFGSVSGRSGRFVVGHFPILVALFSAAAAAALALHVEPDLEGQLFAALRELFVGRLLDGDRRFRRHNGLILPLHLGGLKPINHCSSLPG